LQAESDDLCDSGNYYPQNKELKTIFYIMKTKSFFAAALVVLTIAACSQKGAQKPANGEANGQEEEAQLPTKAERDSASYYLGVSFGQQLKGYDFGELNYSLIDRGIKDFLKAEGDPRDSSFLSQFKYDLMKMNDGINNYLKKRIAYTAAQTKKAEAKFFDDNAKKEGVQTTPSGLQYIILEPGSEVHPGDKDTVMVKYKGTLTDGTEFDASNGDESVQMLMRSVVKGFKEGLGLVGEGGKIKLFIPSELGYGARQVGSIPANSILVFDVDLDQVKPYVEKPKPEPKKK